MRVVNQRLMLAQCGFNRCIESFFLPSVNSWGEESKGVVSGNQQRPFEGYIEAHIMLLSQVVGIARV